MNALYASGQLLTRPGSGGDSSSGQVWARPKLEKLNTQSDSLGPSCSSASNQRLMRWSAVFQQIDIEEATQVGKAPTIRAYGVTRTGHSVLLHIAGFLPYFWIAAPRDFTNADCVPFMDYLNVRVSSALPR